MTLRTFAVMALAAGLVGGCASIPEATPIKVVDQNLAGDAEPPVRAPAPGLDPPSVVRGFVEASASHANEHQAARAYLTTGASENWNDAAVTYVIDDSFSTIEPIAPSVPRTDQRHQVTLTARLVGRLGSNGQFVRDDRNLEFRLNVVKQDAEWRIADPPPGLLATVTNFSSSYRPIRLSYVDPNRNVLVNDRRWVLNRPENALPSRVIGLLLGEPSDDLAGAVTNELRGARTRTNVAPSANDVLTVDLTGVQELNDTQRELAAAQIVRSLDEFHTQPVRILVDGEALVRDRPEWRAADAQKFETAVDLSARLPGLVVQGGRVLKIGLGDELTEAAALAVESIAQSREGTQFAVVATEADRPRLWFGPAQALRPVDLPATTLTTPTWRRDAAEVWTAADGNRVVAVTAAEGAPVVANVDVTQLTRLGRLTELRVSRDGVRVAAIVDNALVLGAVVGSGVRSSVRNVRRLELPSAAQVVDVDWMGTDRLWVATTSLDAPVYEVPVDEFQWRPAGVVNLTPPVVRIAAVLDRPVLVADGNGVWSYDSASQRWESIKIRGVPVPPGAVPVYPG